MTWAGLKANLGAMAALVFSGGLITWMLLIDGFRDVSFQFSESLFPVYMQEIGGLSLEKIGWVMSFFGLAMMISTVPGGWLSDKAGERVGIAAGMALMSGSLFLLVNIPAGGQYQWMYFLGWAIAGVGAGISSPAYQSLISKAVPQKNRGLAFGLFSTSLGLVSLPAPWVGAQMWDKVGPTFPFTVTATVLLLSVIPIWLKFKTPGSEESVTERDASVMTEA